MNLPGQFPTIAVVNLATVDLGLPAGKTLADLVAALQKSLDEHFTLIYGYPAKLVIYPDVKSVPADCWLFLLMDDADVACFTGDTKISLLDGSEVPLKELAETRRGQGFWVYSYDTESGAIVPGFAHSPRLTKRRQKLVKVTLDNGEELKCTADHLFLMRDGTYKPAEQLKPWDSLMPIYRRLSEKHERPAAGYEVVHSGDRAHEVFTHRISDSITRVGKCEICGVEIPDKKHAIRHHRDYNKRNNSPENIQWVTHREHLALHRATGASNLKRLWKQPAFRKMVKRTLAKHLSANGRKCGARNLRRFIESEAGAEMRKRNLPVLLKFAQSDENRRKMRVVGAERLTRWNKSESGRSKSRETALKNHREGKLNPKIFVKELHVRGRLPGTKKLNHDRWHAGRNKIDPSCNLCLATSAEQFNHKVKSVEPMKGRHDVYDIEVDRYHNFALSSGVFVHNSALGYHDILKDGQPVSKIFVKTTIADKELVSVTASHELFEMLLDPFANGYFEDSKGVAYAYEASDAVEEDTFEIDGIAMSNFVYQSWFEPIKHPLGTKFDHLGRLTKPFTMTKGGYVIIKKGGRVSQKFGSKAKAKRFAREHRLGHRSEYRKFYAGQKACIIKPKRGA